MDYITQILAQFLAVMVVITFHEFAHAYVAYKCGDTTPKMQGRVSLNPFEHIDPIGIICCAFFGFGWARPVPINPGNFRNVKKGTAWTSAAGVILNLILSFVGCGLYSFVSMFTISNYLLAFIQLFFYFMFFNKSF